MWQNKFPLLKTIDTDSIDIIKPFFIAMTFTRMSLF